MKRVHIFIEGKVQGVGFRHFTRVNARRIGVQGWVKNLPDGRVEAVFEGEESDLEQLLSLVRQGPPAGYVNNVTADWIAPENEFDGFRVKY